MEPQRGLKFASHVIWVVWALGLIFVGYAASQSFSYTIWFAPVWIFLPLLFINLEQVYLFMSRSTKLYSSTKQYDSVTTIAKYTHSSAHEDDNCAICLSVLSEGESVRQLACSHIYHKQCIDAYFDSQIGLRIPACAMCRQPIIPV